MVNDLGSVYITGGAGTSSWKSGFGTITFDSGGNELWHANEWAELAVWGGHSEAIALDASGNTYVTGLLSNYETHSDYVTVKYDATGTRLWDVRYVTSANDSAQAIGLDADRNVYITGWVYGSGEDYGTIAYDTDGNELWTAFYNGPPGNADDLAYDLAVDQEGTVYVTGGSVGSGTGSDYATIKYVPDPDSDGIPGGSDNCPEVFNPFQENTDTTTDPPGDSYGDACDNCPAVANEGQVNSDADSYGDACDNCPLVGNEDQTNTDVALEAGGASVVGDSLGDQCDDDDDNDGFDDDVEAYLGTVGQDNCAGGFPGPGGDAWPLDINMDTFVTVVGDVLDYSGRIGAWGGPPPDANWMHRLDLNMDNYITVVGDVLRFAGNIGASCT